MRTFLEARGLEADRIRPVQALYRPGQSLLVRYAVGARGADGAARAPIVSAEVRRRPRDPAAPPEGVASRFPVPDPVDRVGSVLVWAYPFDPAIPELPDAGWGPELARADLWEEARPAGVATTLLRYRPTRRAVFRAVAIGRGLRRVRYVKAVPPATGTRLRWSTQTLRASLGRASLRFGLPTAELGDSIFTVPQVAGRSLRALLLAGGTLPAPKRVAGVVRQLAALPLRDAPNAGIDAGGLIEHVDGLLPALLPERALEIGATLERIAEANATAPRRRAWIHGDLYDDQILVGDDHSLGVIDLDRAGAGDPAMDAANLTAHLVALAASSPAARPRLLAYRELLRDELLILLDLAPEDLAWREALVMLAMAAGPFRVLHPDWPTQVAGRVDIASSLLGPTLSRAA